MRLDFCKFKRLLGLGLAASARPGAGSVRALGRCGLGSAEEAVGLGVVNCWSGKDGSG